MIQERFGELDYAHMKELVLGVVSHNFRRNSLTVLMVVVVFHLLGEQHIAPLRRFKFPRLVQTSGRTWL
ncbi:hypothetical protein ACNKHL_16010 [Shigella flexneri]